MVMMMRRTSTMLQLFNFICSLTHLFECVNKNVRLGEIILRFLRFRQTKSTSEGAFCLIMRHLLPHRIFFFQGAEEGNGQNQNHNSGHGIGKRCGGQNTVDTGTGSFAFQSGG